MGTNCNDLMAIVPLCGYEAHSSILLHFNLDLATNRLVARLGHSIARVRASAAISDAQGSVADSGIVSSAAVRVTNLISNCNIQHQDRNAIPRTAACAVEVRANIMRETVLRVGVS
jgi:hypothetical protein